MFDEYVDRMMLESAIENLSRLYEDEEAEIHIREQQKKVQRDKVKAQTDLAKMGLREVEEQIANGTHPHYKPHDHMVDTDRGDLPAPLSEPRSTMLDPPITPGKNLSPNKAGNVRNKQLDGSTRLNDLFD